MGTTASIALVKPSGESKKSLISQIYERQTPEIIIALCGPIGSGVTKVADIIRSRFVNF